MGSFFTNIQVKTVGLNSFMELKEVIIGIMKNFDFDHIETPSDRAIIVSWDESNEWITIYDEQSDSSDIQSLDELASGLSYALGAYTISNLVYDSDLLCMRLFKQGKSLDLYVNDVEIYNEIQNGSRKRNGQLSKWEPLLKEGFNKTSLLDIWKEKAIFAEDKLYSISNAFGWLTLNSCTGYNYKHKEGLNSYDKIIYFRDNNPSPPLFKEGGPTKLELGFYSICLDCRSNAHFVYTVAIHNRGIADKGLSMNLWGTAIEEGCIKSLSADIMFQGKKEIEGVISDVQLQYLDQNSSFPGYVVDFPDYDIPAGAEWLREALSNIDFKKVETMQNKSQTIIKIGLTPTKSGVYELYISLFPSTNVMNGVVHKVKVFVDYSQEQIDELMEEYFQ
jgi:hypothetical protein